MSNGMHVVLFETDSKTLFDVLPTNNAPLNEFGDLNNFVCSVACSKATKQLLEHPYLTIN